jgi:hypothetical protein
LPDASRGQGSLETRILSFARVSFPMQGEPCDTASAARAYGPVAFPQEACPTSCGLRQTPLPCLQALVISRPRTYRLLFTVAADRQLRGSWLQHHAFTAGAFQNDPFRDRPWLPFGYFPFGFTRYLHIRFSWRNLKDDRVCRSLG